MTHVITQRCCNDASCIAACPVDCIRPNPSDPDFSTTEMLYIDPQTCIDCGACADACPVDAIFTEHDLTASLARYTDINAAYFERNPLTPSVAQPTPPPRIHTEVGPLRVAIVGAGPAACYSAVELLTHTNAQVEMLERLPTPYGLVRAGVAPDHSGTKGVTATFESSFKRAAFQYHLNVEVGKHISHEELLEHHHAVIYAVGASTDRQLGIPGEDLPGSVAATEFVAWYNGHPDYADRKFDLSGERVIIVGNGNVAIDVARILTMSPGQLARTDIADHALEALLQSNVREVVLLGRRGPAQAAYTSPEFLALGYLDGVDVIIDDELKPSPELKVQLAYEYSQRAASPDHRRIVFRYLASPVEVLGADRVEGVRIVKNELVADGAGFSAKPTGETETIEGSLVIRSIGYRGAPISGLPFDERRGIVPNHEGRVLHDGETIAGVYVSGWIKRGPRGVIGTNKTDAEQTVAALIQDFANGKLDRPVNDRKSLDELLAERQPDRVDRAGWHAIDEAERRRGKPQGRRRIKFTKVDEMVNVARTSTDNV
ncbi:FAD-dependent oxidoreductase [Smaragdicoccus niigatensis]|uniref:FAD-dependent oxidoreductase n=1 Tax=Smaragdicoccus niigatensis TaxID=359359 RepID=UPI000361EE02|nr:FAD-dependent oxidoreductase [Smaragdicoccus niigatensis]